MVMKSEVPAAQEEETSADVVADRGSPHREPERDEFPREYGGRKGPEPTRYGDWEKNGRCIDF